MYNRKRRIGKENKNWDNENQLQQTNHTTQKWDHIKNDYLYKVARIQENCMLRQKHVNQFTYGEHAEIQKCNKQFEVIEDEEEDEVYLDLDFKPVENKKKGLGILAFEDSDSDKKIEKQECVVETCKKEEVNKIYYLEDSSEDDDVEKQNNEQTERSAGEANKVNRDQQWRREGEQENEEPQEFLEIKKEEIWNFQGFSDDDDGGQVQEKVQQVEKNEEESEIDARQSKSSQKSSSNSESSTSSKQQIKGVKLTANPLEGNVTITIINKKQFIMSPIPPGIIIKCVLRRSSGFLNPFTQFDLFLHNGLKHFVSAKRFPLSSTEIFKISTSTEIYEDEFYVGSLMANTVHSHYWLVSPKQPKQQTEFQFGRLQTLIAYDEKIPKKGERPLKIFICDKDQRALVSLKNQSLDPKIIKNRKHLELFNKIRSDEIGSDKGDCLDSIKSVSIIDKEDEDYEYISLHKVSKDMFHLQIQHPLTPLQAFAFILTRFDAQLK